MIKKSLSFHHICKFNVGDLVYLYGHKPYALAEILNFGTQGCQLHGEPFDVATVMIIEAGHRFKKGDKYVLAMGHMASEAENG